MAAKRGPKSCSACQTGPAFEEFAEATFARCVGLVEMQLASRQAAAAGHAIDYEMAFVVCSLDLISGMAEGLRLSVEPLVGRHPLREILVQCCQVRGACRTDGQTEPGCRWADRQPEECRPLPEDLV
jgi:hypothetical protein